VNEVARDRLGELLSNYGSALTNTPQMCGILIRQKCAECPEEASLLVHAVQKGTVKELLNLGPSPDWEAVSASLAQELSDGVGITTEQASWAVDSWAIALGKHPGARHTEPEPPKPVYEPLTAPNEASTVTATFSTLVGAGCGAVGGGIGAVLRLVIVMVILEAAVDAAPEQVQGQAQALQIMIWVMMLLCVAVGAFFGAIGGALGVYVTRKFTGAQGAGLFWAYVGAGLGSAVGAVGGGFFCGVPGIGIGSLLGGWLGAFSSGRGSMRGGLSNRW
jgi:hypothetical protein